MPGLHGPSASENAEGKIPRTESVRTADWKYITYFDVNPTYEDLYDLKNDPREEKNLAADPAIGKGWLP